MNRAFEPGDAQVPDGEPGHRRETTATGTTPEHDEDARDQEAVHVRVLERLEEVAPLGLVRPGESRVARLLRVDRGREEAHERHERDDHEHDEQDTPRPDFACR